MKLLPSIIAEAVWEISPQRLLQSNIRSLILDLDNTLVDWNQEYLRPEVESWARACRAAGISMLICTNARCKPRTGRIARKIGAGYLSGAGKPAARAYRRSLQLLRATSTETAFVGDQIFTDIWGANRCGLMTFLVKPLSTRDFPATKIPRLFERRLFRRWRKEGKIPENNFKNT